MKKRYTEEQIIGFLKEADRGMAVKELCRRHGFSEQSYYVWRRKFGGMDVSDARRLKSLEAEWASPDIPDTEVRQEYDLGRVIQCGQSLCCRRS